MKEKVAQYRKTLVNLRRDYEETKREEEKAALLEVNFLDVVFAFF